MLEKELKNRFTEVSTLTRNGEAYFFIAKPNGRSCNILLTSDLHQYSMPEETLNNSKSHKELYFLLPEYWDISHLENALLDWLFETLSKLKQYVIENKTWFSDGHTMRANSEGKILSKDMKQTYLMLTDPIFLEVELAPIHIDSMEIGFLGVLPIFKNEFQHKQAFGTQKLMQLFERYQVTERLDEYRTNLVKSRWRRIFG
ncbi:suppressor of fused domain protein [Crocinitomicaceae bacterium]|jgi:hypothetical protein|nr:suppressor of fused domain protein [Crocinitomicaceae bacterium]MDB4648771.1 suppressor of fused domain protein [Crocinitomicaceae bacterium]